VDIPSPEKIVIKFVDRINAHDVDGLAAMMTEDHMFVDSDGDVAQGRDVMRKGWVDYFTNYPEYKIHISKICKSGKAVAILGATSGSHVAPEIEAQETVIWLAKIENGLVAQWCIYTDIDQIKKQQDSNKK
jgi:uncharacterized protein (TIGR02246 family)